YVNSITYGAIGPGTLTMGNGVSQAFTWNDRGQPTNLQITNSTNGPGNPLLNLGFSPCASGGTACASGNNGNLRSQTISTPGYNVNQTYGYDALNRLTCANESTSATTPGSVTPAYPCGSSSVTPNWIQQFGYDRVGNQWLYNHTGLVVATDAPTGA